MSKMLSHPLATFHDMICFPIPLLLLAPPYPVLPTRSTVPFPFQISIPFYSVLFHTILR